MTEPSPIAPLRWGAVTVPWTARWSSEDDTDFEVRQLSIGAKTLPFLCETLDTPGIGKPRLSTMHTGRGIHVVRNKLCQICLRKLVPGQVLAFTTSDQRWGHFPTVKDGQPMCEPCGLLALGSCPALRRRQDAGILEVYRVTGYQPAPAILGLTPPEGGGVERINAALARWKRPPVYGFPMLILRGFQRLPSEAVADMMRIWDAAKAREENTQSC